MAKSNSGHKQHDVYRDDEVAASSCGSVPPSSESLKLIEKLFSTSDATDAATLDPQTMSRLNLVVQEWGHLEFCSKPVCEQLVAAVLLGSSDDRKNLFTSDVVKMVAASLYEDITAKARLTCLWNKLKGNAA